MECRITLPKEKNQYLTPKTIELMRLTRLFTTNCNQKEKGLNNNKAEKSFLVAGARLELTTFGL